MPQNAAGRAGRRFAVHGLAVDIRCAVRSVHELLGVMLSPFEVEAWPDGFVPLAGEIRPFTADVPKHLPATATLLPAPRDVAEVYQENERFWLVDDRWGLLELNVLRGTWKSWLLPAPSLDAVRLAEMAIFWPMAQLLRAKGLHLLPAVSVVRDGVGILILCPFGMEAELRLLARSGYRIVGQRWTALREDAGRLEMLHMPGRVEHIAAPQLRSTGVNVAPPMWVDLHAEYLGSQQNHAFCDAVLVADPGRRSVAELRPLGHSGAINVLRRAWPLLDVQPQRRSSQLPVRLAHACKCFQVQLSREPVDFLKLLDAVRRPAKVPVSPVAPIETPPPAPIPITAGRPPATPSRTPFNTGRAIAV